MALCLFSSILNLALSIIMVKVLSLMVQNPIVMQPEFRGAGVTGIVLCPDYSSFHLDITPQVRPVIFIATQPSHLNVYSINNTLKDPSLSSLSPHTVQEHSLLIPATVPT